MLRKQINLKWTVVNGGKSMEMHKSCHLFRLTYFYLSLLFFTHMHATKHIIHNFYFGFMFIFYIHKITIIFKWKKNKEKDLLTDHETDTIAIVKAIDNSLQEDDGSTTNWKGERWQDENANNNSMSIIVNTAFEEGIKNSDDEHDDAGEEDQEPHAQGAGDEILFAQDIELAIISINESLNSSNEINESPIDGEEMDTSDNNTTNNTQTTAECDDRLLPIEQKHMRNGSGSSNYDDDYEADENLSISVDELRKHNGDYGMKDVQNADETQKLVNGENGSELEDCDYYSDGDNDGDVDAHRGDIIKFNGGDGIIANHFIGLYFSILYSCFIVYVDLFSFWHNLFHFLLLGYKNGDTFNACNYF